MKLGARNVLKGKVVGRGQGRDHRPTSRSMLATASSLTSSCHESEAARDLKASKRATRPTPSSKLRR